MKTTALQRLSTQAFSLVEVTLALGMVTFCMLGLVGLLPLGLNAAKTSRDNSMATSAMGLISDSIHGAKAKYIPADPEAGTPAKVICTAAGRFTEFEWEMGADPTEQVIELSASGLPITEDAEPRFTARVEVTPPTSNADLGTAAVSVAWPAQATWDSDRGEWRNAQGSVRTWLSLLPLAQ